jgi:hypothetical protein
MGGAQDSFIDLREFKRARVRMSSTARNQVPRKEGLHLGQVAVSKKYISALALFVALVICAPTVFARTLASVVDLRTTGATGSENGALFYQNVSQPTGTGYYDPFLRLQDSPIEEAFNTDYRSNGQAPLDAKSDPNYTHSLQLGSLETVNQGGVDYYAFSLDIDEPNSGPFRYISLDELKFYTADVGDLATLADLTNPSIATLRWDLDGVQNSTVYLNGGALSSGNGADDMQVLIPKSAFAGVDPSKYLYLYSKFGATSGMGANNYDANASFEEWRALAKQPTVAEPTTLWLMGAGLLGVAATGRRKQRRI